MQRFLLRKRAEHIYRACLRHTLTKPIWYAYLLCPEWASEGVRCTALRQGKRGPPVVNIKTYHPYMYLPNQYHLPMYTLKLNINISKHCVLKMLAGEKETMKTLWYLYDLWIWGICDVCFSHNFKTDIGLKAVDHIVRTT